MVGHGLISTVYPSVCVDGTLSFLDRESDLTSPFLACQAQEGHPPEYCPMGKKQA